MKPNVTQICSKKEFVSICAWLIFLFSNVVAEFMESIVSPHDHPWQHYHLGWQPTKMEEWQKASHRIQYGKAGVPVDSKNGTIVAKVGSIAISN